jgi:WD40 repeat protein
MDQTQTAEPATTTASPPLPKRRWWRIRYSLRTLLLFVLLAGSAMGLWFRWEPWAAAFALPGYWFTDFSPSGELVIARRSDGEAEIWATHSQQRVSTLRGLRGHIFADFAPDLSRVVAGPPERPLTVWDVRTGTPLQQLGNDTHDLVISFNGKRVCTDNEQSSVIKTWDADSGKLLVSFQQPAPVHTAVVSRDGSRMVTSGGDGTARVWNMEKGVQMIVCRGHTSAVIRARFSPDERRIGTTSWDATARLWDASTGTEQVVLRGHTDFVFGLSFSPDGARVTTASRDHTVRVWDARTGVAQLTLQHPCEVHESHFSSDGTRILTGGKDSALRLWDAADGSLLTCLRVGKGSPRGFFSADAERIYHDGDFPCVWHRRRPEYWYGLAWLPEFWLTILFGSAFMWSVWRDRRTLS